MSGPQRMTGQVEEQVFEIGLPYLHLVQFRHVCGKHLQALVDVVRGRLLPLLLGRGDRDRASDVVRLYLDDSLGFDDSMLDVTEIRRYIADR